MHLHRTRISGLRGFGLPERLPDRPDPVKILGLLRRERDRPLEMRDCLVALVELEADLAKLAVEAGVVRRLFQQFAQQGPGDRQLPGLDQRLNQIRPRRPMARIETQRLEVKPIASRAMPVR
ncbi:hypothetical protein AYJ54_18590 [Bradyrhizobium centrolobii]|uniref:Uncharacterized protein n=1 Tax=Bradyrhizobium centrolobii TaxID=1505087 RepID=A0A176YJB7_9BRAD|nr:hypothetical protein AYJ54_18590 [Bradyrhizobium centrolobii]